MNSEEQKISDDIELAAELRAVKQQVVELRRQLTSLERDNRLLSIMSGNADRLRRAYECPN